MANEGGQKARRRGRVETALEAELIERHDIGAAARAALREQARFVDVAAALSDPELGTRANLGYLHLRQAEGLTAGGARPVDAFDDILARLAAPSSGDVADR
jgi:hypothetical protein